MSTDMMTLIALGEAPKPLLVTRIKTFIDAVEYSQSGHMRKHAAVCFVDFIRCHSDLMKENLPTLIPVFCAKVEEFIEDTRDDETCVANELYDMCVDVLLIFQESVVDECPVTPLPSSKAVECPGAPRRPVTRSQISSSNAEPVTRELFPSSSNAALPSSSNAALPSSSNAALRPHKEEPFFMVWTKRGEIYRAVSKEGVKSSVKCLADNGPLLEIRFGEKTGISLWHMGHRVFDSYEDWQEELQWM
jgi:hypothetical protein